MKSILPNIRADMLVAEDERPVDATKQAEAGEKEPPTAQTVETDDESISSQDQTGIRMIEATTKVWSTSNLVMAYVMIWIIAFVDTMQQGMSGSLTPYVTSSFNEHSLTAATSIMSGIIGGLFKLPLAKILDIWGRPQGFALMMVVLTIGLVMMAGCNNVKTYAAAQVFYWVGYNGMTYTISIFIADTSSLKNRGLMLAYVGSPYIATVWIGGPLATAFLNGPGFRWGFGAFAIITPVITSPLLALFTWNYLKAKKAGLLPPKVDENRSVLQSLKHYAIEFDVIGIILLSGGLALFLLPFSLYSYQADGWRSSMIICMIIFGGLLIITFAVYERFWSPRCFIPFHLLTDRTVLGACILAATLFVSFYIWDTYFSSFLQVVNDLSITQASYIGNIYSIGSCFWSLVVGVLIRWSGRFKWLALYFGVPLTILGVGLMVHFRQPDVNIGYIIMCQIFIAFAGGTLVICEQMAAMAAVSHQYIAVVMAVESMFSSIGGAVGSTIAAAIWTGVFPKRLTEYLPEEEQGNLTQIYGSLPVQRSYPVGSPARIAINRAYGESQKVMLIAATVILVIAIGATVVWRDIKVKDFKQVKGRVV
ncbi:MFS siderochrome iron transporter 1 [Aspergillus wentii]|nr:MFS siderochrome iron transporter 1 [Aspergillus wentii]